MFQVLRFDCLQFWPQGNNKNPIRMVNEHFHCLQLFFNKGTLWLSVPHLWIPCFCWCSSQPFPLCGTTAVPSFLQFTCCHCDSSECWCGLSSAKSGSCTLTEALVSSCFPSGTVTGRDGEALHCLVINWFSASLWSLTAPSPNPEFSNCLCSMLRYLWQHARVWLSGLCGISQVFSYC